MSEKLGGSIMCYSVLFTVQDDMEELSYASCFGYERHHLVLINGGDGDSSDGGDVWSCYIFHRRYEKILRDRKISSEYEQPL